jgi:cytochrome c peroxidase
MKTKNKLALTIPTLATLGLLLSGVTFADQKINRAFLPLFQPLPKVMSAPGREISDTKVDLGRKLYFETRLSINGKISCNTCHLLDKYGVDSLSTSPGHDGRRGDRNSPTVYNAALHVSQFWDGRSPDVEDQAKGPVMNPIEMGMPSAEKVEEVLKSIPGYVDAFAKAFPDEDEAITYNNYAEAVGAFERGLVTPSRWDDFLRGKENELSDAEKAGFNKFVSVGCATCHMGPALGGMMYHKLGLVVPWPNLTDEGRFKATGMEADKYKFKVPGLRNIEKTGPYLHDGSLTKLPEVVRLMARHQLGRELPDEDVAEIVTFLKVLTGKMPAEYIKQPKLPE